MDKVEKNSSGGIEQDDKIMQGSKTPASAKTESNPPKNTAGKVGGGLFNHPKMAGKGK